MANNAKLTVELQVLLRGVRTHEGTIEAHVGQAATDAVAKQLRGLANRERIVADKLASALTALGASSPRLRPSSLPSATSVLAGLAAQAQPLGETLVLEASVVQLLADRATVARGLATALDNGRAVDVTGDLIELYSEYAEWLVTVASELVVDAAAARLVPSVGNRVAGRLKDVLALPARARDQLTDLAVDSVSRATERVKELVGLGAERVSDVAEVAEAALRNGRDASLATVEGEARRRGAGNAAAVVHDTRAGLGVLDAAELPIRDYDGKTALEAVRAVGDLDDLDDLATVLAYEQAHKNRKTVTEAAEKQSTDLTDSMIGV